MNTTTARERHREYYLGIAKENPQDWQRIEQVYEQIKRAWTFLPEDESLLDFISALRTYQERRGLWNDLIDWATQGLQFANTKDMQEKSLNLRHILAIAYVRIGRYEEAIRISEECLNICQQQDNLQGQAGTFNSLGIIYQSQGRLEKSAQMFKKSLRVYMELEDSRRKVKQEVENLKDKGQDVQKLAYNLLLQFGKIFLGGQDIRQEKGRVYNNLGNTYYRQGKLDKAIENFEEYLNLCQELNNRYEESYTLQSLGAAYQGVGRRDDAIQMFERSLSICRELGDRYVEGIALNNLGMIFQSQDLWEEASDMFEQSLNICEEIGDTQGIGSVLNSLGNVYYRQELWKDSIEVFERSKSIHRKLGDAHGESTALTFLGLIYRAKGQQKTAKNLWQEALANQHPDWGLYELVTKFIQEAE